MRTLLVSSLLVASVNVLAHPHPEIKPRKSLSFGPVLPHAVFHTTPSQIPSFLSSRDTCPYSVAQSFVAQLIGGGPNDFALRKDSYTDQNTGVTHVYFRQLVNGLEVADGNINVNVKDGVILSYGNSVSGTSSGSS
jgi:extracellular elastinolytic metalloproteinase